MGIEKTFIHRRINCPCRVSAARSHTQQLSYPQTPHSLAIQDYSGIWIPAARACAGRGRRCGVYMLCGMCKRDASNIPVQAR